MSVLATETVWDSKPIKEICNDASSFSNSIEKFPSKSVDVPLFVPTSRIVAPGSGLPSESVTVPLITLWTSSSSRSSLVSGTIIFSFKITFLSITS